MSGIAGIVHLDGRPVEPGLVHRMTAAMAYRGPDGIDHWASGPAALGHCQLRTTPESLEEAQPVVSADGQRVLVFDGRLDNWVELRQELLLRGARLRNRSDAELVLHAHETWGDACVDHLDGDFALALWDTASRTLFAARDRTGNRALHYRWCAPSLILATDLHALFEVPPTPEHLDIDTIAEYLAIEWMALDRTLWQGISMLKPAHAMRVCGNQLTTWCYWKPTMDLDLGCRNAQEVADAYRALLDDTVRRQSRTIGPLAIEVSGGLDSSALFASAARQADRGTLLATDVLGFTLDMRGDRYADEVDLALGVGKHLGREIEVIAPTRMTLDEYRADIRRFKTYPDIPNGTMGRSIAEAAVARGARSLVSGTGGDEWLGGGEASYAEAMQAFNGADLAKYWRFDLANGGVRHALWAPLRHGLLPLLPDRLRHALRDLTHHLPGGPPDEPWLSPEMHHRILRLRKQERQQPTPSWSRTGQRRQWANLWNPYVMATKHWNERRMARVGLDWRQPLWDARLIQFCFAVPEKHRMHQGVNKWFHRLAFRVDLPPAVRDREDKAEFSVAFAHLWPELQESLQREALPRNKDWLEAQFLLSAMVDSGVESTIWRQGLVWSVFVVDALRNPTAVAHT